MADLKQIIVDTDSAYSGFDYASIVTAESNEQDDLVASGVYMVIECYATAGTADTNVTFDGWVTSGAEYIEVNGLLDSNYGHSGMWTDTEYRIEATNSSAFVISEDHFRVIGIQLYQNNTTSNRHPLNMNGQDDNTGELTFSHNIIRGNGGSTAWIRAIDVEGAGLTGQVVKIHDNLFYDLPTLGSSYGVYQTSSGNVYFYNNTVIGGEYGFFRNSGSITGKNNIFQDQTARGYSSTSTAHGWNIVNDSPLVLQSVGGSTTDLTTGTATSYGANQLNDSGGGLSVAVVGSIVANTTDNTYSFVTVVDSDTQLTLNADIFDTGNETYRVGSNIYGTPDFQASGSENYLLTAEDTLAMFHGTNLYADANNPVTDDILLNSRGSASTDNFDIGAHHSLEYNKIVDTDSGAGYDYASLANWESNEQADLTHSGLGKIAVATCRSTGGTNDTTATTILGWTTEDVNYIKVWTDPDEAYRHPGYWVTGNYYRLTVANDAAITNGENFARFEGLQIQVSGINGNDQCCIVLNPDIDNTANYISISKNIFRGAGGAIGQTAYHFGVEMFGFETGSTGQIDIYNNIIYDFGGTENYNNGGIEFYNDGSTLMFIDCFAYNNTIVDCSKGLESTGTGSGYYLFVKNNLIKGGHRAYNLPSSSTFGTTSTHNAWAGTPVSVGAFGTTWATGQITGVVTDKLEDTGADFSNVQIHSIVVDTTDGAYTHVTALDSSTLLSLANDHFTTTENYAIYTNLTPDTIVFQDEGNDEFLLGTSDTDNKDKAKDLSADANLPITDDILGNTRS